LLRLALELSVLLSGAPHEPTSGHHGLDVNPALPHVRHGHAVMWRDFSLKLFDLFERELLDHPRSFSSSRRPYRKKPEKEV